MKHLPAFKAALVAAAGIITGRLLQQFSIAFLAGGAALLLICGSWFLLRRERMTPFVTSGAYAALFLSFAFYMSISLNSLSEVRPGDYQIYCGTVDEVSPDTSRPSTVLTECYGFRKGWHEIRGDLVLSPKSYLAAGSGDRIIFKGKPGIISPARNPGQLNLVNYYKLRGLAGRIFLQTEDDIIALQHEQGFNFHKDLIIPLRNFIREKTRKFLRGDVSGLALAMVLGERAGISREMNEDFMNSGTIHILSVSGLHIGFLTGILMSLASILRVPRRWRFLLIAPVLVVYAYAVGLTPSVVRAVIMAIIVLFGLFLQRKGSVINSLGFAALFILAFSPSQLFSPGFQLSFAAVLSIAFFYDRMMTSIRKSNPAIIEKPVLNSIISVSLLTIAATLGTVPLSVYYFERISLVAIFANLVVVPLSGIFTSLNFTFLAFSLFSSSLASVYAAAAQLIGFSILIFNSMIGSLSVSTLRIDNSFMLFSALYFAWLAAVFWFGKNAMPKKLVFGILLGADMILYASVFTGRTAARLYVLDVGQGDAIYMELPDGKKILVDAGMKFGKYDAGTRVVVPFLQRRGIEHLDYLVVTHLHADHIGGVVSVLRSVRVDNFIYPDQISNSSTWSSTLAAVRALNIPCRIVRAGTVLDSGRACRIYVLHPNARYVGKNGLAYRTRFNDGSIVLKVCVGSQSVLLAGDVESRVEHDLASTYGAFLASAVLKVAHHGSITGTSQEFLENARPKFAIVSVGTGNRFGHPSDTVINRLTRFGMSVWRTDSLGAAFVQIGANSSRFVHWR